MIRTTEHPAAEALERFINAADTPTERERVEEHLLEGCINCLHVLHSQMAASRLRERGEKRSVVESRAGATTRVDLALVRRHAAIVDRQATVVEAERIVAPGLLEELLLLPPEDRRTALRGAGRYRFYGLAELLTRECRSECFRDVARAVELGSLAIESADALPRGSYPTGLVKDALALAWAAFGNAHRVRANLVEAERALLMARNLLEKGSGDRVARAQILSLLGSLRTDQARFDEATVILTEASEIVRVEGDEVQAGKVLLQLANVRAESGDIDGGVMLATQARSVLERGPDEWLYLLSCQTLATWLREAGRVSEARAVYTDIRPYFDDDTVHPSNVLRLDWLGALLDWSEGSFAAAEEGLVRVGEGFRELDATFDDCLVNLDLAMLYLEGGRVQDVRDLARQLVPIFASRQLHHHALAAVNLFQRAAEAEEATVTFVRELARYLHHSRKNPYLKFQPSGA